MGTEDTSLVAWALAQRPREAALPAVLALPAANWREAGYLATKRAVDIVLGTLVIVLTSPLVLAAALAVKLTSPGPVLFRQKRAGRDGKPFVMYKLRSMLAGAEEDRIHLAGLNEMGDGPCFKLRDDPRLTPVGRFLRRTSIDELPQLFNVLKGEMTLVGPRPLPLVEVCTTRPEERARLKATPGLTCLWQISGRCEIPYDEWMLLDLYYLRNRSLMLDLEILIKTLPAVLTGRGAF